MSENLDPNQGADIPSPDRFKVNGDFLVRKGNDFGSVSECDHSPKTVASAVNASSHFQIATVEA